MRWNPIFNALGAAAYIGVVVLFLHYIESIRHDTPDTIIDGVGFLSLVVFSVAMMGFLFFYRPLTLFLDNKRQEAVAYFLKTLVLFGVFTALALVLTSMQ